jgi:hypothetical protein
MQKESDLNFSSGLTIIPGLSFKSGKKVVSVIPAGLKYETQTNTDSLSDSAVMRKSIL